MTERAAMVLDRLHAAEREALLAFKEALQREFGAHFQGLVLYGSRARGDSGSCAWWDCPEHVAGELDRVGDLDLAVFLRGLSDERRSRTLDLSCDNGMGRSVTLDVHVMTPEGVAKGLERELLYYQDIERDGVKL